MPFRICFIWLFYLSCNLSFAQLFIARDTLSVIEDNYILKMPWNNGINFANVSSVDLNFDGKKDVVAYDKLNLFATGRFRCCINTGNPGEIKYSSGADLSYAFPQVSNWAILLDYNCDGREDIFCSTSAGIKVYKNVSAAPTLSFALIKPLIYSEYNPGGTSAYGNLYASSIGVPGIADVDNDGDLDIITYSPLGVFAEFHRNMRVENNLHCDSLVFELADACWGKFSESSCQVNMNQCVLKQPWDSATINHGERVLHAGACLTCIDSDGDLDQDLIVGDISCNRVQYLKNGGSIATPLIVDTTQLYPNYPANSNTNTIKINNFPCTYYVDVNNDGKKDLVATPNATGSENAKSVWFYKNTSTTNTVNFQYVKNNFLQDEMIEVGQNSFPVLIDYDADGKKDLLIGNYGYYSNNSLKSQLTLYKNIGTAALPSFSLITRDFANLSSRNLNNVMPAVGDVDNDGDVDICIGTSSGQIHWLENTAGAGNPCNFSVFRNNPFSFTTNSAAAAPHLFDIDNDGKLDLLIGTKNGRIAFYKNNSVNAAAPSFTLQSNFFGGVDVKSSPNLYGIDGYAVPFFYKEGNVIKLLVGSVSGTVFYYSLPTNITSNFNLVTDNVNFLNEGAQSAVWFEDINNDNLPDLFVGNASGGLSFFSSKGPSVGLDPTSETDLEKRIQVFPNPAEDVLNILIDHLSFTAATLKIYDLFGKEMKEKMLSGNSENVSLAELKPGLFFVKISLVDEQQRPYTVVRKLIKN